MFSNEEAEEDVFLSQLAVIFLISNLNHWWKLWCSYISYYQTIYVPLTQVIDSTAGFQGASSTFIPRKQRRRNRKRSAEAFQLLVQQDAAYFMDHFRISKACFVAICSFIQRLGFYPPNMRYLARRREVTVAHALGMLLIFIGHGCSYKITGALCGFAKQTTMLHINRIRRIMLDAVVPACICWPSDAEIEMIKADFLERGHIPNVVGAVDGTHIPILIPPDDHVDFINRKSFHSLVFQGVAIGTTLKFINFYGGWAGSVHDAEVFKNSSVCHNFKQGLHQGLVLLADAAYALESWCLTPFERKTPQDVQEANYNFWHSSARMVVERAFGVLKKRFPILKKPWTSNNAEVVEIVTICVALHNLCCDAEREWDAGKFTMVLENAPVGAIPDRAFDMELTLNQRNASAAAKLERVRVAQNIPAQPQGARRQIQADIVRI